MTQPFWETKSLEQLSEQEWESLCDGCARCCLLKLEDAETAELHFTNVSCQLLDTESCRCTDYTNRKQRVPECLQVRQMSRDEYRWLPQSCAYRRLAEGRSLADWHPLVSGNRQSVQQAGVAVGMFVVSERYIHPDQLEEHIIEFKEN